MELETFKKYDEEKPPLHRVLQLESVGEVARVIQYGAEKYGDSNWRLASQEEARARYTSAALRHVSAYLRGEDVDPESGLKHLAHAVTSLLFIMDIEIK